MKLKIISAIKLVYVSLLIAMLIVQYDSKSYDNEVTHRKLTEKAFQNSLLNDSDKFLVKNFEDGFAAELREGVEVTMVHGERVKKWFQDGSDFEDKGKYKYGSQCRASNHFHDPLKPWDEAEMTDGILTVRGNLIYYICALSIPSWLRKDRKSNLTWATGFVEPAPEGNKIDLERQDWNWDDAREYYQLALTSSARADRDSHFANTFRALGHVVHLIQDGAQPEHVRNDFESHLKIRLGWVGSDFEHYVKLQSAQLIPGLTPITPQFENPSLTDFWDTDQYTGTNPSEDLTRGITEITNANYFSFYTLPQKTWRVIQANPPDGPAYDTALYHKYPYPKITHETATLCKSFNENGHYYRYVSRGGSGGCTTADFLAKNKISVTPSLLNEPAAFQAGVISDLRFTMDEVVYRSYAQELLPLAVGYSSAVIDYFFRGELGVIDFPGGLIIKNKNEETMDRYTDEQGNDIGRISIYYDDAQNQRHKLADYDLASPIPKNGKTPLIQFTPPSDNVTPGRYVVAFEGKLGKENGAVIGKVVAPRIYYVSSTTDSMTGKEIRKIMRMDTDGENKTTIFDNKSPTLRIGKLSLSPDSSQLVFQAQASSSSPVESIQLYTLDISEFDQSPSPQPVPLTQGHWANWSPNGDTILFERGEPGLAYDQGNATVWSINIETNQETQLIISSPGNIRGGFDSSWSPDGSKIAYVTNSRQELPGDQTPPCGNAYRSIAYMNPDGAHLGSLSHCLDQRYDNETPILSGTQLYSWGLELGGPSQPGWSPDGEQLIFLAPLETRSFSVDIASSPTPEQVRTGHANAIPYKLNIVTQAETSLYDIADPIFEQSPGLVNYPRLEYSSWSPFEDVLSVAFIGTNYWEPETSDTSDHPYKFSSKENSQPGPEIWTMDSETGAFLEQLTQGGSYFPVYGY